MPLLAVDKTLKVNGQEFIVTKALLSAEVVLVTGWEMNSSDGLVEGELGGEGRCLQTVAPVWERRDSIEDVFDFGSQPVGGQPCGFGIDGDEFAGVEGFAVSIGIRRRDAFEAG